MRYHKTVLALVSAFCMLAFGVRIAHSQQNASSGTVQVNMVITALALNDTDDEVSVLRAENVQVRQGRTPVKVDQLIPAKDPNAALQLFILIDETTMAQGVGNNLNELRDLHAGIVEHRSQDCDAVRSSARTCAVFALAGSPRPHKIRVTRHWKHRAYKRA